MSDYMKNQNSVQVFGEALREVFPDVVEMLSRGGVEQDHDIELMFWEGMEYAFGVKLSNGAEFQIKITQTSQADQNSVDEPFPANEHGEIIECQACGNTPIAAGFHPCESNGIESDPDWAWGGHYFCRGCGKVAKAEAV